MSIGVADSSRRIETSQLTIAVRRDLIEPVARFQQGASSAPETIRAGFQHPVDRSHQVNLPHLELGTFDPKANFAAAEDIVAAAEDIVAAGTNGIIWTPTKLLIFRIFRVKSFLLAS